MRDGAIEKRIRNGTCKGRNVAFQNEWEKGGKTMKNKNIISKLNERYINIYLFIYLSGVFL